MTPPLLEAVLEDGVRVATALDDPFRPLREVLERWFYKPDLQALRIAMGTIKAHYLKIGTPAWLFVVAPPGTGKTTMSIMSACGLQEVQALGDVTENTFLSGFHGHKDPGLLEKLGPTTQEGHIYTTSGNPRIQRTAAKFQALVSLTAVNAPLHSTEVKR